MSFLSLSDLKADLARRLAKPAPVKRLEPLPELLLAMGTKTLVTDELQRMKRAALVRLAVSSALSDAKARVRS